MYNVGRVPISQPKKSSLSSQRLDKRISCNFYITLFPANVTVMTGNTGNEPLVLVPAHHGFSVLPTSQQLLPAQRLVSYALL